MGADIVNLANVLSTQTAAIAPDAQAKQVLKEAVDAVVNSFAKHTQGYGRGKFDSSLSILFFSFVEDVFVVLDWCVCVFFPCSSAIIIVFVFILLFVRCSSAVAVIESQACDRTNHF